MFGKKKLEAASIAADQAEEIAATTLAAWIGENGAAAKTFIMEEMKEFEGLRNGDCHERYISGLADMAFRLQVITMNERAAFAQMAHDKAQEVKATVEPVYKKRGIYEYKGYNIVKIISDSDGTPNWAIRKGDSGEYIKSGIAFKEAISKIDELTK